MNIRFKTSLFFILVAFFSFFLVHQVSAHSGRTDSSGGHNCRTGSCAGTYHYHNGGSATKTVPVIYPTSKPIVYPTSIPTKKIYPTTKPTKIPTKVPTKVPTPKPTEVVAPTAIPTLKAEMSVDEPEVLGVMDDSNDSRGGSSESDLSGGDIFYTLAILGGMGWVGVKGTKTGVRRVKTMVKKVSEGVSGENKK